MMHSIIAYGGLALFLLIAFDAFRTYSASKSTGAARWLDVGRGSLTLLWQQFGLAIAGIIAGADKIVDLIAGLIGDPGADAAIKNALSTWFTPVNAGLALAGYAVITVLARMRTLQRK